MAIDIYDDYVILRMRMNGADSGTTFVDDKGHVVTVVGSPQTKTAVSKFGGASAYFYTTTGNHLAFATLVDWKFTGAFTVEMWVYPTAFNTGGGRIFAIGGGTVGWNSTTGIAVLIQTVASAISVGWWNGTTSTSVSLTASINTWYHIAMSWDGVGAVNVFLDGVKATNTQTFVAPSTTPYMRVGSIPGEANGATQVYTGYVDDLRITKGVARYTTDFTPPTEEMGMGYSKTVSGVVRGIDGELGQRALRLHRRADGLLIDEGFSNPSTGAYTLRALDTQKHYVIAHDTDGIDTYLSMEGSDGGTVFTEMNGKTVTAYGNAHTEVDQYKFGSTSAYFDGTGDYLTIPYSSDFDFSTCNFTIEFWLRPGTLASAQIFIVRRAALAATGFAVSQSITTGYINFYAGDDDTAAWNATVTSSTAVSVGTWVHIAAVRYGSTFQLFMDGASQGTATWSGAIAYSTAPLVIGISSDYSSSPFNGYIDDLRITKGYARYTANFTAPTSPHFTEVSGDQYRNQVVLGTHMEGSDGGTTFTDITGKTVTVAGNTHTEVDQYKFGSTSAYFDGTGDYLSVPDSSEFTFGSSDFTIEFWVYSTVGSTLSDLITKRQDTIDAANFWRVRCTASNTIEVYSYVASAAVTNIVSTTTLSTNTWTHIAVVRRGGTVTVFVGGATGQTDTVNAATAWADTPHPTTIGAYGTASTNYFTGYIDDLRITKGVARYTASFTAPTAAFPDTLPYYGQQNAQILDYITPG